jgi:hypothetical protein
MSSTQGPISQFSAHPDASWRGLYRAGAVSAALYVLMIIVGMALFAIAPQPLSPVDPLYLSTSLLISWYT